MNEHTLQLKPFSMKWLDISLKEPLHNAEDSAVWESVARQYLDLAFRNRRGCILCEILKKDELDLDLTHEQRVKIEGRYFLIGSVMNFSSTLLDQIVEFEQEKFSRGLLLVTSFTDRDEADIHDFLVRWRKKYIDCPVTTHELMFFDPDGEILSWVNPSCPMGQIAAASQTFARSVGWGFRGEIIE